MFPRWAMRTLLRRERATTLSWAERPGTRLPPGPEMTSCSAITVFWKQSQVQLGGWTATICHCRVPTEHSHSQRLTRGWLTWAGTTQFTATPAGILFWVSRAATTFTAELTMTI